MLSGLPEEGYAVGQVLYYIKKGDGLVVAFLCKRQLKGIYAIADRYVGYMRGLDCFFYTFYLEAFFA